MSKPAITTVSLSTRAATRAPHEVASALPSDRSGRCLPTQWLGARSPFGLALPAAKPTASQMYAPRGVWLDAQRLIVCDSGNHRVLIWSKLPASDGAAADVVLGQADFESEGPAQGNKCFERGLHLPTGVLVVGEKLLVADAWHHRILVWNQVPTESNQPADYAIGQSSLTQVEPNRGAGPTSRSLYWPYGLAWIAGRLYVADTGNRRVLVWNNFPDADQPADMVMGQPDMTCSDENRGGPACGNSFRWPHAIAGDERQLWIADAGNHRILGWNEHPDADRAADWVLGQPDLFSSREDPYREQGQRALRFPYGLILQDNILIAADTANNRLLFWTLPIAEPQYAAAMDLIGQADFDHCGENRWQTVSSDSLCWPYGIAVHGQQLAVADSGNNRVMLWDCGGVLAREEQTTGNNQR